MRPVAVSASPETMAGVENQFEMERKDGDYLEWTYENVSFWDRDTHGVCLKHLHSPFHLYPRGLDGHGENLVVEVTDYERSSRVEVSFVGADGSLVCKQQVEDPEWEGNFTTLPPGPKFEEVVRRRGNMDILTLRLHRSSGRWMFGHRRTLIDVVESRCIKIPNHVLRSFEQDQDIYISRFLFDMGNIEYEFNLDATVVDPLHEDSKIHFKLSPDDDMGKYIFIVTWTSLTDSNDIVLKSERNEYKFRDEEEWTVFSVSQLENIAEKEFYFTVSVKFISGHVYHECIIPSKKYAEFIPIILSKNDENLTENTKIVQNRPLTVLAEELMCLYQDQDFSDFTLKCDGVTFPVHRAILSARSPVFKRMLSTDMTEAASGEVVIGDLDPSTLGRFLTFLYSGEVEDLQCDSALKLYYAADKYQVPSLRRECAVVLCDNVSVSNVCDILSLGDSHQDDSLTAVAHDFILKNFNEVLSSKEWVKLMNNDPLLTSKTVTQFAQKKCLGRIGTFLP